MIKLFNKFKKNKNFKIKTILIALVLLISATYLTHQAGYWNTDILVARYNIFKLQKTLSSKGDNPDVLVELGVNYYVAKDLNKAIDANVRATSLNPDDFIAWNNLGNVYRDLVDFWLSRDAYQKSIKINSNYIPAYLNLVNLFNIWPEDEEGDDMRKRIVPLLKQALEANPENGTLQATLKAYVSSTK